MGGSAVLLMKASKYAFFDSTKEIIFIPLDRDSKSVGKAAIDVVAYRLSKCGGSLILQFVIVVWGSITEGGVSAIAVSFLGIVAIWLYAGAQAATIMTNA